MTERNTSGGWRGRLADHLGKLVLMLAVGFASIGFFAAGGVRTAPADSASASSAEEAPVAADEGETTWTCSMHPQIRAPKRGKCPICGMDLIPVAKTAGGMRTLAVSPESAALMRIETSPIERKYVSHEIPMVGRVDYDETRLAYITARVPGRLDRLYVDYAGIEVQEGDHLVYIYSEELYSSQKELLSFLRNRSERPLESTTTTSIERIDYVESARKKLRLLGLTDEQIAKIEKQDGPTDHITIFAPLGGIVIEKLKEQDDRVKLGERIYTIADLSHLWVQLDAYESDLPWVRYGQDVTITTEAFPGEEFHGRIAFIQKVLDDKTRTVKVRVNVPNPEGKLKPEMFVRAIVRPRVAAGGKVMDRSLAGKWISPMHPEVVKDEPGTCDICGMPLVRAESLGYVTPTTDENDAPLVVPYSAALVTGTRAVVYVQLPTMPSSAEPALATLSAVVDEGDPNKIRGAFATYASMLDRPYDAPGTDFARRQWSEYADSLASEALAGQRIASASEAKQVLAKIEATMTEVRERFAPADRPTFEGREIVLGPRAGDYYLVRHGLQEGELVVTQGNFKIDAEIQIQAKPSMMTPEGGGGGGHHHGGAVAKKDAGGVEHEGHKAALPSGFVTGVEELDEAYERVADAVARQDMSKSSAAFAGFAEALNGVDESKLTDHPRMMWKELSMLLGNDAAEGRAVNQAEDADRVFLSLKRNMRRLRQQFGGQTDQPPRVERVASTPEFRSDLAGVWERYLAIGAALAADDPDAVEKPLADLEAAVASVDADSLADPAKEAWRSERQNLEKLIESLKKETEVNAIRARFLPLSQEIGMLARTFGFGADQLVFELHCPMAFQGKGGVWYQGDDKTKNPYFGSTMLGCADRVERIVHASTAGGERAPTGEEHSDGKSHKHHQH